MGVISLRIFILVSYRHFLDLCPTLPMMLCLKLVDKLSLKERFGDNRKSFSDETQIVNSIPRLSGPAEVQRFPVSSVHRFLVIKMILKSSAAFFGFLAENPKIFCHLLVNNHHKFDDKMT